MAIYYVELETGDKALILDLVDQRKDSGGVLVCKNPDKKTLREFLNGNLKNLRNRFVYSNGGEALQNTPTLEAKIASLNGNLKVYEPVLWRDSLVEMGLMCKEPGCLGLLGLINKSGYCKKCIEKTPNRRNRPSYYKRLQQENLGDHLKNQRADDEALNNLTTEHINQIIELFGGDKVDIAIQLAILANPVYKQEIKLSHEVIGKIIQVITDQHFNKLNNTWNPVALEDSWLKLESTAHQWMDNAGLSDWKRKQILERIKQIFLPQNFAP